MAGFDDFKDIRTWRGTQYSAWEELCYQLRDPTPDGARLRKTGNPDGGVEWYVIYGNGVQHGWQAKFSADVSTLLSGMEESLRTVVDERPSMRRLTFCVPVDFSDSKAHGKSGWERLETAKRRWLKDIKGAQRVDIEVWPAGEILSRLSKPEHRGRRWFFWDEEVFDPAWCRKRLEVAVDVADDRYTPTAHVDLPIARALEGLGRDDRLVADFRERAAAVASEERQLRSTSSTGLGLRRELSALTKAMRACVDAAEAALDVDGGRALDVEDLVEAASDALAVVEEAWPNVSVPNDSSTEAEKDRFSRAKAVEQRVNHSAVALRSVLSLARSPRQDASRKGILLVKGEAGQGKTHLLCDSAARRVEAGQPAALILAQGLSAQSLWSSIAENLALPHKGADELLSAMAAAGEAANRPFVLHIDAINETPDADRWPDALPRLVAELRRHEWITCVLSLRSDFAPLVLPEHGPGDDVQEIEHGGFAGREAEALAIYFDRYGLSEPSVPLLASEFVNPLFLKLYCEGAEDGVLPATDGHEHLAAVFDRYLRSRFRRIERQLKLDPGDDVPREALNGLVDAYISAGHDRLPRAEVSKLVRSYAPHQHEHPKTLFGCLISEGVLTEELAYRRGDKPERVVRFSYQGLGDHAIVARQLGRVPDLAALKTALGSGKSLQAWVRAAPPGWQRALSMQVPERFGVELLDAARWNLPADERVAWLRAFVRGLPLRAADSITAKTEALIRESQKAGFGASALEATLSVAAVPGHPLNAERLHSKLMTYTMPERDVAWSVPMYDAHEDNPALDRLIRWAARAPHPSAPDDVVELAALPLLWMLTSPNRFGRDYITKALSVLLRDRPRLLTSLIERTCAIDDPYVRERLAVVAHGALLSSEPVAGCAEVCHALGRLLDGSRPDILLRDAVRGAHEWALRAGLVGDAELVAASPPYGAEAPALTTTMAELEERFDRSRKQSGSRQEYGSLFYSLASMGDFGRYVVDAEVRDFRAASLSEPFPARDRRRHDDRAITLDRASAWIFERVLELGWTPDRFAQIDRAVARRDTGRQSHKPERFGKKYQWIALRELIARLSDNHHFDKGWRDDPPMTYDGPWQMLARDIDPTLRPSPLVRDDDGYVTRGDTFAPAEDDAWWVPRAPDLFPGFPEDAPADWAFREDKEPAVKDLLKPVDENGRVWLPLESRFEWGDDVEYGGGSRERRQRHLWMYVYSWLCQTKDLERLLRALRKRSLIGQWMPKSPELTNDAYLGEMPWAAAALEWPPEWETPRPRDDDGPIDVAVLPGGVQYYWEGHTRDCSMQDGVRCWMPAFELFEAGALRWQPDGRRWATPDGAVVAQYEEAGEHHSSLLVDPSWLAGVLGERDLSLVLGVVGEREFYDAGWAGGHVGGWTVLDSVSAFKDGKLRLGKLRRTKETSRS